MKNICFILLTFCLFSSCKKSGEIGTYNTEKSYIYFAYPNPSTGNIVERYIDSLQYSFKLEDNLDITEKTLAIPVNVIGVPENNDRSFTLVVNQDSTTLDMASVTIAPAIIHKDKTTDTLFITIKKTAALKEGVRYLYLNLQENENFGVGHNYNSKIKIAVTDRLLEPAWWTRWVPYMGPYYEEVYFYWIQMYYFGADPSYSISGEHPGPYYYWDNMPSAVPSWFPVTFMYIRKLKEFFQQNEIYPGGDTSKPRILLP